MENTDNYYQELAAAFVRGKCSQGAVCLPTELRSKKFLELTSEDLGMIIRAGAAAKLRLHKFKRTMGLRRVNRVLGILRSLQPRSLLDVGSGRGAFLWPLLDSFAELEVTCIDRNEIRVGDIHALRIGGIERLSAKTMDATRMTFEDASFDIVTFLEVLEHIPEAQMSLNQAMRVARCSVIVSVPSKADNNPQHIHLFSAANLKEMFFSAGAKSVNVDYVLNHMIAVAQVKS
jgi:2-polyprenyl-3-methyl-5-hydroxy-6-metoxy-1,4-benzoquinol methylase